jgi:anaerobic magnesium-protoporphyrin IX monomethyl ester cyclase
MISILLVDNVDLPPKSAYQFPHASQPLGIQYLASYLKRHLPTEVGEVRCLSLPLALLQGRDPLQAVLSLLRVRRFDLVGIRSLTSGREFLESLTRAIKEEFGGLPIVVGGPYASDSAHLILSDHGAVDYTCSGEGEEVLREFVGALLLGRGSIREVRGLGYRVDGFPVVNEPMPWIKDLDSIPFPDHADVDLGEFALVENPMRIPNGERWAPLFTQRGCPYRCTYCHEGFGKAGRQRSAQNVLEEIFWLHREKGVTHFAVLDDIFNVEKDRAKAIMRGVIRSGLRVRFSFPNALRGDIMDRELVDLLVEAGTVCIHYAVESASPRIQKWVKKNLRLSKLDEIVDYTSQFNVLLRGFYMVGFPGETEEELRATVDHAIQSRFTETYLSVLCMWPGTRIHEAAVRDGFIHRGTWTNSLSSEVRDNGFRYTESLLSQERLRGYGATHFSKDRWRRNTEILSSLGVPPEQVIAKELKYALLLRDGWSRSGPNPYLPEPAIVDLLLEVDAGRLGSVACYEAISTLLASEQGPPIPGNRRAAVENGSNSVLGEL